MVVSDKLHLKSLKILWDTYFNPRVLILSLLQMPGDVPT